MFKYAIIFLMSQTVLLAAESSMVQDSFDKPFVGYKMEPFLLQEAPDCLLKPYLPTFNTTYDILNGPFYKRDNSKSSVK